MSADKGSRSLTRCLGKSAAAEWRRGVAAAAERLFAEADRARAKVAGQGPVRHPTEPTYWLERRTGNGVTEWSQITGWPMIPRTFTSGARAL